MKCRFIELPISDLPVFLHFNMGFGEMFSRKKYDWNIEMPTIFSVSMETTAYYTPIY